MLQQIAQLSPTLKEAELRTLLYLTSTALARGATSMRIATLRTRGHRKAILNQTFPLHRASYQVINGVHFAPRRALLARTAREAQQ